MYRTVLPFHWPTTFTFTGAYSIVHMTSAGVMSAGLPLAAARTAQASAADACEPPTGAQVSVAVRGAASAVLTVMTTLLAAGAAAAGLRAEQDADEGGSGGGGDGDQVATHWKLPRVLVTLHSVTYPHSVGNPL